MFELLEETESPSPPEDRPHAPWQFAIGRRGTDETLAWLLRLGPGYEAPRGYLESVRQRFAQWRALGALPGEIDAELVEMDGAPPVLAAFMPDGESLPSYLRRVPVLPEGVTSRLGEELVRWLVVLADAPRVLANASLSDFFVHWEDGVAPALAFCPAFAMVREETVLSDYRLAREWTERLARLHAWLAGGRKKDPESLFPQDNRAFRGLFKDLETGRDRPLAERFEEIGIRFGRSPGSKTGPFPAASLPLGPVARILRERALQDAPERFSRMPAEISAIVPSPYRLAEAPRPDGAARVAHLLPPERWFADSLVDPLNRRLADPFLKAHHHCLRIRAIYCDDSLTLLTGDAVASIPLPSWLAARGGMAAAELLLLAAKLHRALAQFDSVGFDPGLVSPWQVELRLEEGVAPPGRERLLHTSLADWPAWDVLLRTERPVECFLPAASAAGWRRAREALAGKFFPALVAWALDWKRFQWAARHRTLGGEPSSWDARLASLFGAATAHLDPARTVHRERFLAFLEQALGSDG